MMMMMIMMVMMVMMMMMMKPINSSGSCQISDPWQMLTSTDVVEVIDAPVKLEDLRGVPRYRDLSQSRQRSSEANIFTERRGNWISIGRELELELRMVLSDLRT